ncbi:hypothetical protein [Emticicia sp. C21]|uniref:hypothetical protein n=1 Tax=Emticicia sp. C21 TaxID=2302915 RepID=UPI000E353796|nr:hypothetical protein [Emticicia sp. C21]RFS17177.1 hypothetical protein D0T08_05160 [Emticicia sp. C21]
MKSLRYLLGPEFIWFISAVGIKYFGKYNISIQGKYNDTLESMAYWLPLLMVAACMSIYYIPVAPKGYLLLRIIVASIIGSHFVFAYCAASHTVGGPGVGALYIMGISFTIAVLFVASLVKLFFLALK